ncbi:MAG: hypothetical protein K2I14_02115, partial [Eubacterium sp.]|nr:hypothetical protein [Eubacterium sp.]
ALERGNHLMRLDVFTILAENKDNLIPLLSFSLLSVIFGLIVRGLKEIYSRASAVVKFLMIVVGILFLIIIVLSLMAVYVFLLE